MISVDTCLGKQIECKIPPAEIKSLITKGDRTIWVDVVAPSDEDWDLITAQFGFHPLAMEDARKQNQRSKVDEYDTYLFLSLRAWTGFGDDIADVSDVSDEIDVFLGANYLVTIHQNPCLAVAETRRRWEQHPDMMSNQPGFLLYELLDAVVDEFFPAMDALDVEIDEMETAIYSSTRDISVAPALRMKKRLLLLRQTVGPMRDLLNHLLRSDLKFIPPEARIYFQDVYDHALREVEQVDLHRDILAGVLDAMVAQTSNRLNQVMKTMTGVSTILMSAALVTGIYGMNFEHMPELHTHNGYYWALAAMGAISIVLTVFFKRIKWF